MRFRLGADHSFLQQRLLGRNLITVFSTVNTPTQLFCDAGAARDLPHASKASATGARNAAAAAAAAVRACRKPLFFSAFVEAKD
ncbi:hypothetical protein [Luteimonas suaedae]|uniref:hypothetical protein n=1 Tax=Luteimonas suaedae TaxID=2605430 RepID=UPI0011F04431|nr:hypothetical protein [Luteimonas suaedae]